MFSFFDLYSKEASDGNGIDKIFNYAYIISTATKNVKIPKDLFYRIFNEGKYNLHSSPIE